MPLSSFDSEFSIEIAPPEQTRKEFKDWSNIKSFIGSKLFWIILVSFFISVAFGVLILYGSWWHEERRLRQQNNGTVNSRIDSNWTSINRSSYLLPIASFPTPSD